MKLQVLYGGTFDPVHNGHLGVARHARDALGADIALMPAADPPHKGPTQADAAERARMLQLAVGDEPGLRIDLRELRRSGPSYTVDTLRALREEVGAQAPWAILVGEDSFRSLPAWHEWQALFALAHIVVAGRAPAAAHASEPHGAALAEPLDGATVDRWVDTPAQLLQRPSGLLYALRQPLFPQSASALRQRIAAGQPWHDWVPPAVAHYIEHRGLYR
jgi:nicotinate-nucleotide adenylyltransferase